MTRNCRLSIAAVAMVCLIGTQLDAALMASTSSDPGAERDAFTPAEPASALSAAHVTLFRGPQNRELTARPTALQAVSADGSWFAIRNDEATGADPRSASDLNAIHRTFTLAPAVSNAFAAGQVYRGRPYRARRDRGGSIAALAIGAVATITGAAILIYGNRPECSRRVFASGCGFGTKVVGGAVLSGGAVSLTIGAITWR
jgi:hypothetical protein